MSWLTKLKWLRITTEPPHVESNKIVELHALLREEKAARAKQAKDAVIAAKVLAKELEVAKEKELIRLAANKNNEQKAALTNLAIAERYENMLADNELSKGRVSTLRGIIDVRVERAENLLGEKIPNISDKLNELELILNGY